MIKKIFSTSRVLLLAVVLSVGGGYVYAWKAPNSVPPAGNVDAPITVGAGTQTKTNGDICTLNGGVTKCLSAAQMAAPTVTISASPATVANGGSSTLTWSSTNATSCTASGSWSGAKAISGTQSTGALTGPANFNYTLACTGIGGTVSANASVFAQASCTTGTQVFSTPSATPYTFTVPSPCTHITVTAIGGGGGGGGYGYHPGGGYYGAAGGSGATRGGTFPVTPGQSLNVYVGAGGTPGGYMACSAGGVGYNAGTGSCYTAYINGSGGGGGGGSSALVNGSTPLVMAPAGGGGGAPPSYVSNRCYGGARGGNGGGTGAGAGGAGSAYGTCSTAGMTAGGNAAAPIAGNQGAAWNAAGGNGSISITWNP